MAMSIVVVAASVVIPIGRAFARRIAGGAPYGEALREVQALRDEVERLRDELALMQGRVAELDDVQNRLDFAERMLAQARAKGALGAGAEPQGR